MSQEYTPVVWVDETENQVGTVINKARLDQMQSAHHYADGFEEVDAVPTADPHVDYHKVVFCTADTTFYRWDGTQWVKDVDDSTLALLEAHEADHNNPHVVTKSQVGLGNVDNKASVSAWQTTPVNNHIPTEKLVKDSLDGKVAIISVTSGVKFYAQSSGGTTLYQGTSTPVTGITSVPMRDSSGRIETAAPSADDDAANKKYVDDADALKINTSALVSAWQTTPDDSHIPSEKLVEDSLDTKVDKLITSPAGTYYKVTVNAQGQVTSGSSPTTLSGYGITDAVKANASITGATKCKITYDAKGLVTAGADLAASDIPALDWSKITSGKPTTLAGYGITDAIVIGPGTVTSGNVAIFDGTTGKKIKDSGYTIATSVPSGAVFTDTKNTAGAGNVIGTKLYLVGRSAQSTGTSQSNINCYIGTDNCLYSNGTKVLTAHQSLSNYVTLNGAQTITAVKTHNANLVMNTTSSMGVNWAQTPSINGTLNGTTFYQMYVGGNTDSGSGVVRYVQVWNANRSHFAELQIRALNNNSVDIWLLKDGSWSQSVKIAEYS